MKCEYCGKEHDGTYGSGRFCSHSCQAKFTNKQRGSLSDDTKRKISEALHKRRTPVTCIICGKKFYINEGYNSSRKFCSEACHDKYFSNLKDYVDYSFIMKKMNETKIKNNSFNRSKQEDIIYEKIHKKYPNVIRQYSSNLYPYSCDFYIPSLDLYIEYNGTWTHGNHPYNENSEEDNLIVETWKNKNTKYYNNAIYTWTDLDVRKRKIAEENNLNYIEIWNIEEIDKLLQYWEEA